MQLAFWHFKLIVKLSDLQIRQQLEQLHALMQETEHRYASSFTTVHPSQLASALNLLEYLSLRSTDIQRLQDGLHERGLSSLANSESHIRSQVAAVLKHFHVLKEDAFPDYSHSRIFLEQRARILFGKLSADSIPSITVTLKTSHAYDVRAVKKLIQSGMNIARINCAHDSEKIWLAIVKAVRQASASTGIPCKIYMDLAGPKIRTVIHKKVGRIPVEEEDQFYLADRKISKDNLPVVGSSIPALAAQLREGKGFCLTMDLLKLK
jgi:pyruvate kinase